MNKEQEIIKKLQILKQVNPRPYFIDKVRNSLVYSLTNRQAQKTPLFVFRLAIASFLVVFLVSGGAVFASKGSLPGDFLYPVKIALEEVRIRLTDDSADLRIRLTEQRLKEIQELKEKEDQDIEKAASEYKKAIDKALENASEEVDKSNLLNKLQEKLDLHSQVLQEQSQAAPAQAKEALNKAAEASQKGAAAAKEALEKDPHPESSPQNQENLPSNQKKGRR